MHPGILVQVIKQRSKSGSRSRSEYRSWSRSESGSRSGYRSWSRSESKSVSWSRSNSSIERTQSRIV
jgi:hypothetical protein